MASFYSNDSQYDVEEHETLEQASGAATEVLQAFEEIYTETDHASYGIMIPLARMVELEFRDAPKGTQEADEWNKRDITAVARLELVKTTADDPEVVEATTELRKAGLIPVDSELTSRLEELTRKVLACDMPRCKTCSHNGSITKEAQCLSSGTRGLPRDGSGFCCHHEVKA